MTDDSMLVGGDGAFDINQASSVGEVDAWIESLMACKQLSEVDVKKLCDKVRLRWSLSTMHHDGSGVAACAKAFGADPLGTRDLAGRVQCPGSTFSGDGVWRHTWPIS